MKRNLTTAIVIPLFACIVYFGCGGTKQIATTTQPATDQIIDKIPKWYKDPPNDPNFVFAAGTATSRDMQLSKDKAGDAARLEIARTVEVRFQGLSKRFQEEVGTSANSQYLDQFTQATKSVVSTTLTGVVTEKSDLQNEKGVFRSYVLLKLPLGLSSEALLNKLKQQEQLYTKFRSSEVFKELEKEVEAFDKYKQQQGK